MQVRNFSEEFIKILERIRNNDPTLIKLDLSHHRIGCEGAEVLAKVLEINMFLIEINLTYNLIKDRGAQVLFESLKENPSIIKLNLSNNHIGDESVKILSEVLRGKTSLSKIDLSHNDITNTELGNVLKINKSVTELNLSYNNLSEESAMKFGEALAENTSLSDLNLSYNNMGNEEYNIWRDGQSWKSGLESTKKLAKGLERNKFLTRLDLSYSGIGDEGAEKLAEALEKNTSLRLIKLDSNIIGDNGALKLVSGLKENVSLTFISLNKNRIGKLGIAALKKIGFNDEKNQEFRKKRNVQYFTFLIDSLIQRNSFTQFITLDLSISKLNDDELLSLASIPKAKTSITKLILSKNEFSHDGMRAVVEMLKSSKTLQLLDLSSNAIGYRPMWNAGIHYIAESLKDNKTLQELYLANTGLSEYNFATLVSCLICNPTLKFLDLSNNPSLSDKIIGELQKLVCSYVGTNKQLTIKWSDNPQLSDNLKKSYQTIGGEIVDLSNQTFSSSRWLELLNALKSNTIIKKLRFGNCQLTDKQVIALVKVLREDKIATLELLDLSNNNLTNNCIEALLTLIDLSIIPNIEGNYQIKSYWHTKIYQAINERSMKSSSEPVVEKKNNEVIDEQKNEGIEIEYKVDEKGDQSSNEPVIISPPPKPKPQYQMFPTKELMLLLKLSSDYEIEKLFSNQIDLETSGWRAWLVDKYLVKRDEAYFAFLLSNMNTSVLNHFISKTLSKTNVLFSFFGYITGKNTLTLQNILGEELGQIPEALRQLSSYLTQFISDERLDIIKLVFHLLNDKLLFEFLSDESNSPYHMEIYKICAGCNIPGMNIETVKSAFDCIKKLQKIIQDPKNKDIMQKAIDNDFKDYITVVTQLLGSDYQAFVKLISPISNLLENLKDIIPTYLEPQFSTNPQLVANLAELAFQTAGQALQLGKSNQLAQCEIDRQSYVDVFKLFEPIIDDHRVGIVDHTPKGKLLKQCQLSGLTFTSIEKESYNKEQVYCSFKTLAFVNKPFSFKEACFKDFVIENSYFENCDFDGSQYLGVNYLTNVIFTHCSFNHVRFEGRTSFNNMTIDFETAQTLLPALESALDNNAFSVRSFEGQIHLMGMNVDNEEIVIDERLKPYIKQGNTSWIKFVSKQQRISKISADANEMSPDHALLEEFLPAAKESIESKEEALIQPIEGNRDTTSWTSLVGDYLAPFIPSYIKNPFGTSQAEPNEPPKELLDPVSHLPKDDQIFSVDQYCISESEMESANKIMENKMRMIYEIREELEARIKRQEDISDSQQIELGQLAKQAKEYEIWQSYWKEKKARYDAHKEFKENKNCWAYYELMYIRLENLFTGFKSIGSGYIKTDVKGNIGKFASALSIVDLSFCPPAQAILGSIVTAMKYIDEQRLNNLIKHIGELATNKDTSKAVEYLARLLTQRYLEQINLVVDAHSEEESASRNRMIKFKDTLNEVVLNKPISTDIDRLVNFAILRLLSPLLEQSILPDRDTNSSSSSYQTLAHQLIDYVNDPLTKMEKFLGSICNAMKLHKLTTKDGKEWTLAGFYLKPGITIHHKNGQIDRYIITDGSLNTSDWKLYGFREGTVYEIKQLGGKVQRLEETVNVLAPKVTQLKKPVKKKESTYSSEMKQIVRKSDLLDLKNQAAKVPWLERLVRKQEERITRLEQMVQNTAVAVPPTNLQSTQVIDSRANNGEATSLRRSSSPLQMNSHFSVTGSITAPSFQDEEEKVQENSM